MKEILKRHMQAKDTVQIISLGIKNGEAIGLTGKILQVTDDPYNPAVVMEWTTSRTDVAQSSGTTTFNIRNIVSVRKWEARSTNYGSTGGYTASAATSKDWRREFGGL